LADRPELAATLPHTRHSFPQLFVRDVQIPLRLFDVGMAEHQLNGADVYAIGEEATRSFVAQVMPVQVNLSEPDAIAIHPGARLHTLRLVPIRAQKQSLPRRFEALLEFP
jgi:hypothetical protein